MTESQSGTRIDYRNGKLIVPDDPIVPFIEGDGTGADIWRATRYVLDGTVAKVYGGKKKFDWFEVLAGDKAFADTGEYLPPARLDAIRVYRVSIKGPLSSPVRGRIRAI